MADKLRRAKDIIKKNTENFLKATTGDYNKYYEGTPTYIIYYQLNRELSTQDVGLETVSSFIGTTSPKKYRKIYDVSVRGIDALDIANEINERGLLSTINGEMIFLPNTIRPYPGDFFSFEVEGMESHLFRISDVQFDKATPNKFFRCQFSLSNANAEMILNNVEDEYILSTTDSGSAVVKKSDAVNSEKAQTLVDALIDRYTQMYYDVDMDTFMYHSGEYSYWSPYLQHFLHDTKTLSKYTNEILTEIYINDINEIDNKKIYSEKVYRDSIFRKLILQDKSLDFSMNFINISDYDLKSTRNLPFFNSALDYKLISPIDVRDDYLGYINAVLLLFDNETKFSDIDHYHKVHIMDELHLARLEKYIKAGDIIYECNRHELEPTKVCMAIEKIDSEGQTYLEINDVSIENLIKNDYDLEGLELLKIISMFLNNTFKLDEPTLEMINDLYIENSLKNYILLPMVIYVIKDCIAKNEK